MLQVCADFRDEVDELHGFLQKLEDEDWNRETGFMEWTPWDVVAHLHYYDLLSLAALESGEAFVEARAEATAAVTKGRTSKEIARERFAELDARDLLERWRAGDRQDRELERVLMQTVRGIARGLRNTG